MTIKKIPTSEEERMLKSPRNLGGISRRRKKAGDGGGGDGKGGRREFSAAAAAELEPDAVTVEDRWAQIRKNAAERAARHRRPTRTMTPAGKRVSIGLAKRDLVAPVMLTRNVQPLRLASPHQGRVAELTGNMESTKQPVKQEPTTCPR
jgi:hypothetical protein